MTLEELERDPSSKRLAQGEAPRNVDCCALPPHYLWVVDDDGRVTKAIIQDNGDVREL